MMLLSSHAGDSSYIYIADKLTHGGELYIECYDNHNTAQILLSASDRSNIVKAINVAEGYCAGSSDQAVLDLAAKHGLEVSFRYDKQSGRGNIEPRRLKVGHDGVTTTREGHKIVTGHDPDRDDVRAYRLDRIVGGVTLSSV